MTEAQANAVADSTLPLQQQMQPSSSSQPQPQSPQLQPPPPQSATDCAALLTALRATGAGERDPLRWHYLERLHARTPAQPPAVQRVLEDRLARALAHYQQRWDPTPQKTDPAMGSAQIPTQAGSDLARQEQEQEPKQQQQTGRARSASANPPRPGSALGALVRALAQPASEPGAAGDAEDRGGMRSELKSVRQFRNTWSKLSADRQLSQAMGQAPKNAGPINSHMLVLRALTLMREVSPDYLNRFISYADTLLCLEQAEQERTPAKPADAGAAAHKVKVRRKRS